MYCTVEKNSIDKREIFKTFGARAQQPREQSQSDSGSAMSRSASTKNAFIPVNNLLFSIAKFFLDFYFLIFVTEIEFLFLLHIK